MRISNIEIMSIIETLADLLCRKNMALLATVLSRWQISMKKTDNDIDNDYYDDVEFRDV